MKHKTVDFSTVPGSAVRSPAGCLKTGNCPQIVKVRASRSLFANRRAEGGIEPRVFSSGGLRVRLPSTTSYLICFCILCGALATAAPVPVRHKEGLVHGFLTLSTLDGEIIATGDLVQFAHGERVTDHLTFHFKDGSLHDETTVFSQQDYFRLVSYHLVQKGPTFPSTMDLSIVAATGQVTVRSTDDKGKETVSAEQMKLPPDIANGLVPTLLKNVEPKDAPIRFSMVVATPKPRLVKLAISDQGEDPFTLAWSSRKAKHYVVKIELGGVAGVVAPLVGKQPPDAGVWILGGEAPAFVRSQNLSYVGGPMWRIDLLSPVWPSAPPDSKGASSAKP
jgi:hypothetical protein